MSESYCGGEEARVKRIKKRAESLERCEVVMDSGSFLFETCQRSLFAWKLSKRLFVLALAWMDHAPCAETTDAAPSGQRHDEEYQGKSGAVDRIKK